MEEEGEKWYSCLIPNCCKNIDCFSCKLPTCIKTFWNKFTNSKWGDLLDKVEEMDVTDSDWWLGLLMIFLVLLPKAVKFLTLDVVFPGMDVYSDCDAAHMHFKYVLTAFQNFF